MPSLSFDFSQTYALQIDPYWRYSNTTGTGQYIWGPLSQNVRAMTVADLNGDGLNDLIAFPTYFNEGGTPGPSIAPMVLFNDGGGHWTEQILILPDIHVGSPNSVFTFSWNGSTYIFVADQGMETGDPTTFPYSHNWLISYDAGTHTFVDETHLLPNNALAFNHLSWAGHVSSMSNFDVLVPNLGGDNPNVTDIGGGVRWYEFTPGGVIDKTSSLPTEVQESEDRFTFGDSDNIQSSIGGVTVSDLNSDGYSDLVTLGYSPDTQGTFDSIRVFEGTASGFSNSPVIMQAPSFVQESHYFSGATDNRTMSAVQAFAADIEGTGRNDLIVLWEGAGQDYIQILRNNGSFSFADVTSSFFGGITPYFNGTFKDAAGNWSMTVSSIEVKDINGDGRSDLLIHGYNSAPSELASGAVTQDFIYLNHAGQYFAPYDFTNLTSDTISTLASNTAITAWQTGIPLIADVTGDGVPDLATVTPSQTATTTVNDNIYSDFYRAWQADAEWLHQSFNGRMRDELLNESLFVDLDRARQLIGAWAADYNTARPHSSLGYKTPAAYAGRLNAPKSVILAAALIAAG